MPANSAKIIKFYHSSLWTKARQHKLEISRGICERCGGVSLEVHHKVPLEDENVDNPTVAIRMNDLELLCSSCHDAVRHESRGVRQDIAFMVEGDVIKRNAK